jgi:hypothetical protein
MASTATHDGFPRSKAATSSQVAFQASANQSVVKQRLESMHLKKEIQLKKIIQRLSHPRYIELFHNYTVKNIGRLSQTFRAVRRLTAFGVSWLFTSLR